MTQIEKEQFLGNYIGCEIEWLRESDNKWIATTLTASDFSFLVKKKCRLIVKSIESITDEDAIEVGQIINQSNFMYIEVFKHKEFNGIKLLTTDNYGDAYGGTVEINFNGDIKWNYHNIDEFEYTGIRIMEAYDFLRSKGYLPPFRQYSVEKIIESGIAKI